MNRNWAMITAILLAACNNDTEKTPEKEPSAASQFVGEWNNLYMKVDIVSKNNSDTNDVLEVDRSQWEEKLKIKPIRTHLRADSTWNSAHYNLSDSLVYNPAGKWWIEGDKIVFLQNFPGPDTTKYSFVLKGDTVSFETMLDWDVDGKRDDKYYGTQIKKPAN